MPSAAIGCELEALLGLGEVGTCSRDMPSAASSSKRNTNKRNAKHDLKKLKFEMI
jgi:hypothetical protein